MFQNELIKNTLMQQKRLAPDFFSFLKWRMVEKKNILLVKEYLKVKYYIEILHKFN